MYVCIVYCIKSWYLQVIECIRPTYFVIHLSTSVLNNLEEAWEYVEHYVQAIAVNVNDRNY